MERARRKRLSGGDDTMEVRPRKVKFMEEVDYKMEEDDGSSNLK